MAHAVPACPQFTAWATTSLHVASGNDYAGYFYRLSRSLLGRCDPHSKLDKSSLRTLQAGVLIGLYQVQHAKFAQAWLTVSRADWLTQTIRSHKLDCLDGAARRSSSSSSSSSSIREGENDADLLEEARRAQWATSSLACMLMKGGRLVGPIDEMTTWLPISKAHEQQGSNRIGIQEIFRNAAPRPFSVEEARRTAGAAVEVAVEEGSLLRLREGDVHVFDLADEVADPRGGLVDLPWVGGRLTQRIVIHAKHSGTTRYETDRLPYSFWTHQHQVEQTLRYLRSFVGTDSSSAAGQKTMLDLYLKAWGVVLDEAKLKKTHVSRSAASSTQDRAGEDQVLQRTLKLAETLLIRVVPRDAASTITVSWVIYVALQSILRCRQRQSAREHATTADIMVHWCGTAELPAELSTGMPVTVTHSLMDSSDALQSMLVQLGRDNPIAIFFLGQFDAEKRNSSADLDKRLVGLVDLAAG
ncbi:hypothetical protein Ct61P_11066 [Colletotrichum tofieldiae]|nr:hypothetical protein Ct61P_11066 [Colletotrichum tofieldiae]